MAYTIVRPQPPAPYVEISRPAGNGVPLVLTKRGSGHVAISAADVEHSTGLQWCAVVSRADLQAALDAFEDMEADDD